MMRKNKSSKKIVSILLALALVITSLPIMLFSAATIPYDPAPKFSEDAIEEGARAWLDDDGNVHVAYPAANAEDTYKGEELSIAFYILELVDMGSKSSSHTNIVLDTIKVTGTSGIFPAADIGKIDLENNRYSVTVTAVDTENWFSLPLYTTVTEVPTFEYDAERYQVFTADTTAAREIMTYDSGSDDGAVTGGVLQYLGSTPQVGVEDETGKDTNALRFMMRSQPTSTQTFDTSYSRQTWDYVGADEVWFWMDLTDVELTGLAFRLRTNEKLRAEWKSGKTGDINETQRAGDVVYSTKGTAASTYTGEAPYVWVQREDGGWNKVMLKSDGTLDIGNFKGYVRIPLKFMCSETATYVDISNQEFNTGKNFVSGALFKLNKDNAFAWMKSMTFSQKILVDNAGTSVSDALLLQRRAYKTMSGAFNATSNTFTWNINGQYHVEEKNPNYDYSQVGYMLAMPLDNNAATTSVTTGNHSSDRAYVANGSVQNREAGLKAIEDIYNAGFSIEGCSSDSIDNSFYLDNVFFYRDDGEQWTDLSLSGYDANTGESMYNYYDQETIIATAIFDAVDKYISTPDWADYREVEYILDMIDGYKRAIEEANSKNTTADTKISTDFLSFENLAIKSQELGRDSWQNAVDAYLACVEAGTIRVIEETGEIICRANASKDELVPLIVNQMEKLPEPENITAVSDALREYILEIWKAYSLLNLGQLEMLGEEEEIKILKYIALLDGLADIDKEEFIVGQSLADRPFVLFDDFENYEVGTQSYKLEDAVNIYNKGDSDKYTDYRYTKNLVTYAPETFEDFGGKGKDTDNNALSTLLGVAQPTQDGFDNSLKTKASWATITEDGFQGSKGATMYIDSQFYSSGEGVYNVLSTTYKGVEAANIDALRAQGTGNSSVKLGDLAKSFSGVEPNPYLSLVFYVDFTQLTDFNMSATIQTYFNGDLNDFQIAMGTNATDQNFFILDPDSGEWVQANNAADAGRSFAYTSRAGADTNGDGVFDITLAGYKGYVRIPLYHFKPGNNGQKLDESAEALNNIYRISIGIAPGSEAAAVEMDGRSYVIDNIGFSYDPSAYSDGVASRKAAGVTDPYFDEFFDAKSVPTANFEIMVDAIDPYEKSTLQTEVTNALAVYNSLSDYQKSLVQEEKDTLDLYLQYVAGTSTLPNPVYTPEQVEAFIDTLPDALKNATIEEIPEPGFSNGAVNYGAMGITREIADEIIKYYQESYTRFSTTQKASIENSAQFINAYNMCMRMTQTLEDIKNASLTFLPELTSLYTVKYDYDGDGVLDDLDESVTDSDAYKVGNFVSIAGRDEVETFRTDKYNPLQYYSKTSIDDGSIYPQLQNTSRGFTYFLNNTRSFTVDGEEINGGIITFRNKLQNIYDNASTKITNRERLSEDEIREIKDTLEEYNNFLPAYYNVEELYELEQKILRLFPVSEVAVFDAETGGSEVTEVSLNNDNEDSMKKTVYVDMTYIATLLESSEIKSIADVSTSVTLQAVSDLKLTQMEGTTYSSLNSFTAGSLVADTVLDLGEYDNLEPNEVFARIPIEISVDKSVASRAPTGSVYEGSITFNVYETADVEAGLTGEDLVPIATLELPIVFTSTNGQNISTYKVEIPADQEIGWDDTESKDVSYTVEATLGDDKLTVGVADSNADGNNVNDMTSTKTDADGTVYKLIYDAENFKETEFTGDVLAGTKPTDIPTLTIKQEYWDAVPVGEYKTQLTYTVALGSST